MSCFDKNKDISNVKNTLLQWILQNILEKQTFQRTAKFIMVGSYEMDFIKCTISWSLLATVYLSRDEDGIGWSKFLLRSAHKCPYVYYTPSFIKGQASFCKRYNCIERVWTLQYWWNWSTVVERSKKIERTKNLTFNKDL